MSLDVDIKFMQRALELAQNGAGQVAPNPMVGAVVVHNNRIIGEGWHQHYGGPHAEVNAINAVQDKDRHLLKESTIYVNLEPCSHHGKTPPCADLLVGESLKRVVIANADPHKLVAGKGIERLQKAGIEVTAGILEAEGRELNKRFFTYHEKQRPYIILKWAQSADGFFSKDNKEQHWITGELSRKLVHKWRSEEDAILVGTQTALADNPKLDTRLWPGGKTPLRLVLDKELMLPKDLELFNGKQPTVVVSERSGSVINADIWQLPFDDLLLPALLKELYQHDVQSLIIEGGAQLLNSFIEMDLWDEARVFHGTAVWTKGIKAPILPKEPHFMEMVGHDRLYWFKNKVC